MAGVTPSSPKRSASPRSTAASISSQRVAHCVPSCLLYRPRRSVMEPEPDRIDLSSLDPSRDAERWDAVASRVATRAIELRRLRRAVVRRGTVAVVLAAAAGLALWFSA